jgi:phospholipid transport system substrate-binding protein
MKMTFSAGTPSALVAAIGLALFALAPQARAEADPAAAQIDGFDNALIGVMKQADQLGVRGRVRKLTPEIERAFNMPIMTKFAVGPAWTGMSDADHTALIGAFTRYSAASYAHNFDGYTGEKFVVDPNVVTRGPDKIVATQLIPGHGETVVIDYRMRNDGGTWKIIDVLFKGTISQLSTRRSDFAATVASGGASALIAHMDAQTEKLLK